uniref:CSON008974 protein n=1 Tax=Culicoides sonorensis TaxID=179676 RepID=A0A336MBJ4_CULSO
MLSSVLIYNIFNNIQEDDLQHLLFFTEYGRLALYNSGKIPFQRLQFLVRDWMNPDEAKYGANGGQKILKDRLKFKDGQHPELKFLREHLTSCFDDISCFLMPHPGLKIRQNFDGRLSLLEPEFRTELQNLVPMLLAPENLVFMGDKLPEPKMLLAATAEASNLAAFEAAKDIYIQEIEEFCKNNSHLNASALQEKHDFIKEQAINEFKGKFKMGDEALIKSYNERLQHEVDNQ